VFTLALALVTTGCTWSLGRDEEANAAPLATAAPTPAATLPPSLAGAEIGGKWQQAMLAELERGEGGATDAYGLFSEGGWVNAGHVMLYGVLGVPKRVDLVGAGKNEIGERRDLTTAEAAQLAPLLAKDTDLANVEVTAFDALAFEYVHLRRAADGTVTRVHRFVYRNPGVKPAAAHDALISALQALRRPPAAK
jgi:hypothetical protein